MKKIIFYLVFLILNSLPSKAISQLDTLILAVKVLSSKGKVEKALITVTPIPSKKSQSIIGLTRIPNRTTDKDGLAKIKIPKNIHTQFDRYNVKINGSEFRLFSEEIFINKSQEIIFTLTDINSIVRYDAPSREITHKELSLTSYLNLSQVLNFYIPSIAATPQTISDLTDGEVPVTLKGLSPDQFLILVDGKRRHASSLVNINRTIGRGGVTNDLNSIPVGMVDAIEIYPTSASVRYGSDAIAGVINIKLKKTNLYNENDNGFSVGLSAHSGATLGGQYGERNDGQGKQINLSVGKTIKIADENQGTLLFGGEYTSLGALNRSGDYDFGSKGIYYTTDGDNKAQNAINKAQDIKKIGAKSFWEKTGLYGNTIVEAGRAETVDKSAFFNFQIPIQEKITFFADGNINHRNVNSTGFYRFPRETSRIDTTLYPDGFLPRLNPAITDVFFSSGLTITKNNWQYDFSVSSGNNNIVIDLTNTLNASFGRASQTSFYAGKYNYSQNVVDFNAYGHPIKNLTVDYGILVRREKYQIFSGEPSSYVTGPIRNVESAAQVFPGITPENQVREFRSNIGLYAELSYKLPLNFELKAGLRREDYYAENKNIYKDNKDYEPYTKMFSVVYNAHEKLKLIVSYNEGLKAPSLAQTYFNSSSTQTTGGVPKRVFTINVDSPTRSQLGFNDLIPETAKTFNLAATYKIGKVNVSLNTYLINIKDRITLSGQLNKDSLNKEVKIQSILLSAGISTAQFFLNAAKTTTFGLEGHLRYSDDETTKFRFNPTLSWFVNFQNKVKRIKGDTLAEISNLPESLDKINNVILNREEISKLESYQPYNKGFKQLPFYKIILNFPIQGAIFKTSQYELVTRFTVFGNVSYRSPGNESSSQDQNYSAKLLVDLRLGILPNENKLNIFIGCNNIINTFPERNAGKNLDNNQFLYSRRSPQFDLTGRYFYTGLRLNL